MLDPPTPTILEDIMTKTKVKKPRCQHAKCPLPINEPNDLHLCDRCLDRAEKLSQRKKMSSVSSIGTSGEPLYNTICKEMDGKKRNISAADYVQAQRDIRSLTPAQLEAAGRVLHKAQFPSRFVGHLYGNIMLPTYRAGMINVVLRGNYEVV